MNEVSLKYQGADIVMTSNEEKGQRTKEGVKVLIGRAEKSRAEQSSGHFFLSSISSASSPISSSSSRYLTGRSSESVTSYRAFLSHFTIFRVKYVLAVVPTAHLT